MARFGKTLDVIEEGVSLSFLVCLVWLPQTETFSKSNKKRCRIPLRFWSRNWRAGSVVKNKHCSIRGLELGSQHLHQVTQECLTWPPWALSHTQHTYIHTNKSFKKVVHPNTLFENIPRAMDIMGWWNPTYVQNQIPPELQLNKSVSLKATILSFFWMTTEV